MGKDAYTETEAIGWLLWNQARYAHLPGISGTARYLEISGDRAAVLLERVASPRDDDRKVWALRHLFGHLLYGATLDRDSIVEITGYSKSVVSQMMMELSRVVPLCNENLWFIRADGCGRR
jgi:hypothetical protein